MNPLRLFPGSRPAAGPATGAAAGPDEPARVRPAPPVGPASQGAGDRVELSEAARAQQAEAAARQTEVDAARRALRDQPGLSEARLAELRERVADGYYDRPEVVDATAARLADDLRPARS